MLADRPRLRQRLGELRRRAAAGDEVRSALAVLQTDAQSSAQRCAQRRQRLPQPSYAEDLPVSARRHDIAAVILKHQVVVIAGETGSGKTTQLPKICLGLGRGAAARIGHTQPRRIAARSVATRVAAELGGEIGQAVGFQVRFQERVGEHTALKIMTDGILLAETQSDPDLLAYDTLIIDEAHERSLNIDFLLGYLKKLLPRRPDLKLVITSATIDTARFAQHFGDAPVVQVSGRTYPVETLYRPLRSDDDDSQDRNLTQGVVDAVDELARRERGDVLVFLSGEREIRDVAEALRKHHPPQTEILALFARLSVTEQNKIFQAHGQRRIVLATNVAETSLTVPGIRYVIDTGYARISRYSHRSKVQRLPIEKISRASADQRKGRCGRTGPGVCIRLYDQQDYLVRPEFTEPEIQRTNLAAVILRMLDLGLGDVAAFPFVDTPDERYINDGYRLLAELGAVDGKRKLTDLGRQLAQLPLDPRIGRMLLAAQQLNCVSEVLVIASALTVQDPRERPLEAQEKSDAAHAPFRDTKSDFVGFLKLWDFYHEQRRHLSQNKLRRLCRENFLSYVRMREWYDLHQQLAGQIKQMGMPMNQLPADYDAVHQALLAGLLGNIGFKREAREYVGGHGKSFMIFPGSGVFKSAPKWIMAAELVETGRLYARVVAAIQPQWIERTAGHLVKRSYAEPHWEKRPAQVAAYEKVSLYGIDLVTRRKVNYGSIDPAISRELFIRGALVAGDYVTQAEFFTHNRDFVQEIVRLEDKARRRDILVDDETLYEFYARRIPDEVYSGKTFERWRREVERERPRRLFLRREDLLRQAQHGVSQEQFPDHLQYDGLRFALQYRFEPGAEDDGVTLVLPLLALNQIDAGRLQWLVPGLLQEKIVALIKTLPKSLRRNFVPAPDFAQACVEVLTPGAEDLLDALGQQLRRMTGVAVPRQAWQPASLPDHLRMNLRVVDAQGRSLANGRDIGELQSRLSGQAQTSFNDITDQNFEREELETWDFGDLAESVQFTRGDLTLHGYPALVRDSGRVALRLLDSAESARQATRLGVCALFALEQRKEVDYLRRNLPNLQSMCLRYVPIGSCAQFKGDLVDLILRRAVLGESAEIRTASEYEARRRHARGCLIPIGNEVCAVLSTTLDAYQRVAKLIKRPASAACLHALNDMREQLQGLIAPGFLRTTPWSALSHFPRYLAAMERCLQKLEQNPARDSQMQRELTPLWNRCCQRLDQQQRQGVRDAGLEAYRWMLEELRVSLFAQELKTAYPVSVKRAERQWLQLQA